MLMVHGFTEIKIKFFFCDNGGFISYYNITMITIKKKVSLENDTQNVPK